MTLTTSKSTNLIRRIEYTPVGLNILAPLAYDEFETLIQWLVLIDEAIQWWWGDALRYGEKTYGETYTQAAGMANRTPKTLQNWVYVASAVEPSRRRENLSFSHHAAVASLEPKEQSLLLRWASVYGATVRELTKRVAEHTGSKQPQRVTCEVCEGKGYYLE